MVVGGPKRSKNEEEEEKEDEEEEEEEDKEQEVARGPKNRRYSTKNTPTIYDVCMHLCPK